MIEPAPPVTGGPESGAESGADGVFDIVVIGAGGAGMAAALFAAIRGLSVVLIEKSTVVGGTTALAAGTAWIPNTHLARAIGAEDDPEKAAGYLRNAIGNHSSEAMRRAFLEAGPHAIEMLEANSEVKFRARTHHPDYLAELDGATLFGRALEPLPFDGRRLGRHFALLHDPLPELTVLGGMMVDRDDLRHLLAAKRHWGAFTHSLGILARHAADRLRYRRGTRLVMGNALCGRLLLSLLERGVPIWTEIRVTGLERSGGRVARVTLVRQGRATALTARRGIVLATGGFNHHPVLREALLHAPAPTHSPIPATNTGDGIELARAQGARLGERHIDNAFWAPVSLSRRRDGSIGTLPHFFLDRGKPGVIAVDAAGRRFVNEATSYHRFVRGMYEAHRTTPAVPCTLIAEHRAVMRYGLGLVRPGGGGLRRALAEGYVTKADTLPALAAVLGIDGAGLATAVARFNGLARAGDDSDFGRGRTAFDRNLGDPEHRPNPCLGPLETAPFYALRLHPGDIGASIGLVIDAEARVLDGGGAPIPGLYACGNDMESVMGGAYPGPGVTIGPALAFAYRAMTDAAGAAPP